MREKILSCLMEFGLLAILIYTPLIHATKGIATLTVTHILILFLGMLWLLGVNARRDSRFIRSPLNLPLALFLLFAFLSTLFSINKGASLSELYKVATFILLYFLLLNNLTEGYQFKAIILTILGVGGVVAGYGLWQYFSRWPNLAEIASTFPPNPNSLAGYLLLIIPLAFAFTLFSPRRWLAGIGLFISALTFICLFATHSRGGGLALFGSLLFFFLLIFKYLKREEILRVRGRFLALALLLLLLFGAFVSLHLILKPSLAKQIPQAVEEAKIYPSPQISTREPSDVSLGEPITFRFFTPLEILAKGRADAFGALSPTGFTFQRTSANKFIIDRLQIWGRTLRIIKNYPLFGTGMGTYGIIFKRCKIPVPLTSETIARYGLSARFAHNEYLQIGAETGLPSLVLFLWIITLIFRTGLKTLRKSKRMEFKEELNPEPLTLNPQPYLIIALLSGLTGVLLHSLVDFVLRPPATDILFVYFAALIMLLAKTGARPAGKLANGVTGITGQPITPNKLLSHLCHSPLIRASLIICLTLVLVGQVTFPLLAHWHYERGINFQKKGTLDRAISEYLIVQRLDPFNARYPKYLGDFYRHLALSQEEERDFWLKKAKEQYKRMILLSPLDGHYRKDLGVVCWLISQGQNKVLMNEAISQFKESLRIDPTFSFSSCALGVIYAKIGWRDRAIEEFNKAVYHEPNYAESHYNLAMLYASQGLFEKAISHCQEIIRIGNRNLSPRISCGYEKALLTFNYPLVHLQLGALYERVGRIEEAKAEYEHLLKIRPDFAPAKEALAKLKSIR